MIPELLKSLAGSVVRWLLTAVGAWLVSKNIVSESDFNQVVVGIAAGGAALAWSFWNKYKHRLLLLLALDLPAGTSEEVAKRKADNGTSGVSVWMIALILSVTFALSACGDSGREFVKNTDRVAGYIGTGLSMVNRLESDETLSTAGALQATRVLKQLDLANRELITVAKSYKITDASGNTKIELPVEGKARLLAILDSSTTAINSLISNPEVIKIDAGKRKQIVDLLNSLNLTMKSLIDLVNAAKQK